MGLWKGIFDSRPRAHFIDHHADTRIEDLETYLIIECLLSRFAHKESGNIIGPYL